MSTDRTIRPCDAPQARRRADRAFARHAFTMVEVVIVLAVIGIVAGIALPRYVSSLGRYRVDMAARRLAADLAMAQSKARSTGSFRTVQFSNHNLTYKINEEAQLNKNNKLGYTVNLDDDPFAVAVSSFTTSDGGSKVVFDGYGQPAQSLTIQVANGNHSRTVSVDQRTGAISVSTP